MILHLVLMWLGGPQAMAIPSLPVALVYDGPGACAEDDCSKAAGAVAERAGFRVRYVGPSEVNPAIFNGASVWLQPGGVAATMSEAMAPALKQNLRRFIFGGGGYVGFCAGGFLATSMVGMTDVPGLGIFPGTSILLEGIYSAHGVILPMMWYGATKYIYFEGGPYFVFSSRSGVEATAYYADSSVGSARTRYGSGRVYVTGAHPEAPADWRENPTLPDPDGVDLDVAAAMVRWAAFGL